MTWDVVIPAGGTIDATFAGAIGSPYRALAPLGMADKPVLQHVVDTLRASGGVGRIVCVAPPPVAEIIRGVDRWLPAEESGTDNIRAGLLHTASGEPAMVCASDLPLITPESVRAFIKACGAEAGVAVGLVGAEDFKRDFPDAPPSEFVSLADVGPVTLGGLFLVRPDLLVLPENRFRQLFGARKSQWRMASLLGPQLLWQFATKTLKLGSIVSRAETLLGGTIQIVSDTAPVLAFDIDTHDDYTYAHTCYSRTQGQPAAIPPSPLSP